MGAICSGHEKTADQKADARIMNDLKKAAKDDRSVYKTLLLGTGESGKSTIFKQMLKLHGGGIGDSKLKGMHVFVKRNALESMIVLVKQSRTFVEEKKDDCAITAEHTHLIDRILAYEEDDVGSALTSNVGAELAEMWSDPGIKQTMTYRSDFTLHLIDNAAYFLDKVEEIFNDDYQVTDDDAFRVRVMTTGMTEHSFEMDGGLTMLLVDVGGQRSERRKWIRWFDGVDLVLFIVAVSEFDQMLFEDTTVNRFRESLKVWSDIVNMDQFRGTNFTLFLNKADILQEKIKTLNIGDHIEEYKGDEHNYDAAMEFFQDQYLGAMVEDRDVSVYFTTATDSDIMTNVLDNVRNAILMQELGNHGMIDQM